VGIVFTVASITWSTVPFVIISIWYSHHSWLISGFVIRVKQWVPLVEQELLILSEYIPSPRVSLWNSHCPVLCRSLFVFCPFYSLSVYWLSFNIRLLITPLVSSKLSITETKTNSKRTGQKINVINIKVVAKQQLNAMKLEFICFRSLLAIDNKNHNWRFY
jgi:hypothetical protein